MKFFRKPFAAVPGTGTPAACEENGQFSIGRAMIDPAAGEVLLDGATHHLEPRLMAVLTLLAQRPGQVVTRAQLLDEVWNGDRAGDESLTQAISGLRSILGDSPRSPTFIQTIPKTGYRLIAEPLRGRQVGVRASGAATWQGFSRVRLMRPALPAVLIVLLALFAAAATYIDPNPDTESNPNPDYDIEIEDLDFD